MMRLEMEIKKAYGKKIYSLVANSVTGAARAVVASADVRRTERRILEERLYFDCGDVK